MLDEMHLHNFFEDRRPQNEVVPFDIVIADWIKKCAPEFERAVMKDYKIIGDLRFDSKTPEEGRPLYTATAAPPCSRKSTIMDLFAKTAADPRVANSVIIDPDRYVMDQMVHTWHPLKTAGEIAERGYGEALQRAYDLARPGSNIISNTLMNTAFDGRFNILHGTTMTSPFIGGMLKTLGDAGYERQLLLCFASNAMRLEMAKERTDNQGHFQNTEADFLEKGIAFPQRMMDYFTHGDNLPMFWTDDLVSLPTMAAEYTAAGTLEVYNQADFNAILAKYEQDRQQADLPKWSACEDAFRQRPRAFA